MCILHADSVDILPRLVDLLSLVAGSGQCFLFIDAPETITPEDRWHGHQGRFTAKLVVENSSDSVPYRNGRLAFTLYTYGTSGYLALQSLPLLFTPGLIVSLLASEPRRMTDLETYFSRSLGSAFLLIAALNLLLTGSIPLSSSAAAGVVNAIDSNGLSKDPYAYPTLIVTTVYHALIAFYIYANLQWTAPGGWSFALGAGLVLSTLLFCMGMWTVMFGTEAGRVSKKTGADKRTSNFPFENKESAREIKKKDKESEKESRRREKEKEKEKDSDKESKRREKERDSDKEKSERKKRSVARTNSSRGLCYDIGEVDVLLSEMCQDESGKHNVHKCASVDALHYTGLV
nr:hypothetical protein CFP56_71591 [Quercus suber]